MIAYLPWLAIGVMTGFGAGVVYCLSDETRNERDRFQVKQLRFTSLFKLGGFKRKWLFLSASEALRLHVFNVQNSSENSNNCLTLFINKKYLPSLLLRNIKRLFEKPPYPPILGVI